MKTLPDFSGLLMNISYLYCGGSGKHSHNHGNHSGDHTLRECKVTTKYIGPMNCERDKTRDLPGFCPVCNMNREPVKELVDEYGKGHNQGCRQTMQSWQRLYQNDLFPKRYFNWRLKLR